DKCYPPPRRMTSENYLKPKRHTSKAIPRKQVASRMQIKNDWEPETSHEYFPSIEVARHGELELPAEEDIHAELDPGSYVDEDQPADSIPEGYDI
ncbi:hypothetical protein ACJ73_09392, partial [Blastomyces percursus]